MHTFDGNKIRIHYNSDMSGDCIIFNKEDGQEIRVPCEDILDFVANYVRNQKISKLEQMETKDVFGIQ